MIDAPARTPNPEVTATPHRLVLRPIRSRSLPAPRSPRCAATHRPTPHRGGRRRRRQSDRLPSGTTDRQGPIHAGLPDNDQGPQTLLVLKEQVMTITRVNSKAFLGALAASGYVHAVAVMLPLRS